MRQFFSWVILVSALFLMHTQKAHAQVIDYGAFEELFGESVTTSATGSPQRAPDVPVTMEIITANDIRRSGATSLPDVLKTVPGLSVWDWARSNSDVGIRGYNQAYSPRLLVLINGREVYSNTYNYTPWATLPVQMSEIRQIEVVKGPNTALFGFNAVGGVINIITYDPEFDDVDNIGATVGTDDYGHAHVVQTLQGKRANARISASGTLMDEFDADTASAGFPDPDLLSGSFDGTLRLTDTSRVRLELSRSHSDYTEYSPVYTAFDSEYTVESTQLTYDVDTPLGMLQVKAYKNWMDQTVKNVGPVYNTLTVLQVQDLFQIGNKHNFRLQGEYRESAVKSPAFFGPGGTLGYSVLAMSGMWNWQLQNNLSWTNALRVDRLKLERTGAALPTVFTNNNAFDTSFVEYSYNSGLVWQVTDSDTLRFSTSRGIQSPSLVNFGVYYQVPPLPVTFVGNPDIDSTIVTNYEVGYDRNISRINGKLRTSVFYQHTKDLKDGTASSFGAPPTFLAGNVGDSSTVGAEVSLKGRLNDKWHWDANYTIQTVDDDITGMGNAVRSEGNAEHILNAHIGYTNGPWEIDGYSTYVSDYDVQEPGAGVSYVPHSVSDYVTFSGRVGYQVNDNVTVALHGQELNHSSDPRTSGPKVEREVFLSLSANF